MSRVRPEIPFYRTEAFERFHDELYGAAYENLITSLVRHQPVLRSLDEYALVSSASSALYAGYNELAERSANELLAVKNGTGY